MRHSEDTLSGTDMIPPERCQISSRGENCFLQKTVSSESHQGSGAAALRPFVRFLHVQLLPSTCTLGTEAEEVTDASQRFNEKQSCAAGRAVSVAAGAASA